MKRVSAIILSLVMIFSVFAVNASAAEYEEKNVFSTWRPSFWYSDGSFNYGELIPPRTTPTGRRT